MNSRSVSTSRLRNCSFSRRMASSMSSELGASGLGRRRRVGDCVPSPLIPTLAAPPGDPPFCWLASCCASRNAESSRERRLTCDSDSASSTFSSSIFSSWSCSSTLSKLLRTPLAEETNLFEFAREYVYDALLLRFVGIYQIFLTLTAAGATGTGKSPDWRGERHCRGVSMTEVTKDEPSEPNP
jgi:hypothetical protein